jgi:CPA1 family monovalent cation:H+ antiporter
MDNPVELVIGLILAATVLATIARRIGIPYPVLLVLGGLVLGFIPGLPKVVIPPDVVFLIFIPPLVYIAATQVTLRDFRNNLRPILLLSIGLVIATLCFVAGVTVWGVEGFTWTTGFLLAAIIGPTDTVAVNAVTGEVAIPRRVGVILEGESLVNDIVALVAYKIAVDAVMTGTISLASASYMLAWGSIGGIGIGLLVGVAAAWVRKRLEDPSVNIAASLLTGFATYLAAEAVHASGILATVTAGLYVGRRLSKILPPEGRLQAFAFWETITFLLEGLAFVLIGLELRTIMDDLADFSLATLFTYAALVSGAVILLRLVWVFPFSYLPRYFSRRIREKDPYPPWQQIFLVGWAGMRGVDSLAAALALPLVLPNQSPFPQRNLILFLAFSVILSTLVLQGLSLPLLIRWMRVKDDNQDQREEAHARLAAAQAALERLEEEEIVKNTSNEVLLRLRGMYEHRVRRFQAQLNPNDDGGCEEIIDTLHQLLIDLLHTERRVVIELRDQGIISDDVLRRIERSLDFEELRLVQ